MKKSSRKQIEKQSPTYVLQYFNGVGWDPQYGFGPFMDKKEAEATLVNRGYSRFRYRIAKYGPYRKS
jgi:hypothetical protein